ncbi:sulfite exporter TauE/SafE family protein [Alicyclobacillus dauci]|uniref:Probable membrane transporter protein n=1 Tax=Alicyclobacillus dauci TaxID=1475485 RepID=A0ABY6Z871_9BACL|nr:TSUP family transporter [Alicyclobacillus dauci]WAH38444.1 TSUP family transporter [Alicyclobacillus dauci]
MLHVNEFTWITLAISGFVAAFVDSTVGGGGLISLPALLFVGLPPAAALGTNKLAGTMSAVTSTLSYLRSGKVNYRLVGPVFPLGIIGAAAGAIVVHHLPSAFLRPLVLVLLIAVAAYTLVKKNLGLNPNRQDLPRHVFVWAGLAALVIGFYDGFFGPGTGSFLMMVFVLLGFDFVNASGNARTINFASNIGALVAFVSLGAVHYVAGLILGVSMVLGALVGSQFAIRKGVRYVRPIFIGVTCLVIAQQVYTLVVR